MLDTEQVRLLLIRHGQTPNNVAGALDTAFPGAGLTDLGHRQAAAVPAALDALVPEQIVALHGSPLVRTQLTAAPLGRALSLEVDVREGLEEIAAGDLEMRTDEDAVDIYRDTVADWIHRRLDRRMPGGETGAEFLERYGAAIEALAGDRGPGEAVAVVSHGAAIRAYATLAADLDAHEIAGRYLMNTGLVALDGSPSSGWTLAQWRSEPLGGVELEDVLAHDVTGEGVEDEDGSF